MRSRRDNNEGKWDDEFFKAILYMRLYGFITGLQAVLDRIGTVRLCRRFGSLHTSYVKLCLLSMDSSRDTVKIFALCRSKIRRSILKLESLSHVHERCEQLIRLFLFVPTHPTKPMRFLPLLTFPIWSSHLPVSLRSILLLIFASEAWNWPHRIRPPALTRAWILRIAVWKILRCIRNLRGVNLVSYWVHCLEEGLTTAFYRTPRSPLSSGSVYFKHPFQRMALSRTVPPDRCFNRDFLALPSRKYLRPPPARLKASAISVVPHFSFLEGRCFFDTETVGRACTWAGIRVFEAACWGRFSQKKARNPQLLGISFTSSHTATLPHNHRRCWQIRFLPRILCMRSNPERQIFGALWLLSTWFQRHVEISK